MVVFGRVKCVELRNFSYNGLVKGSARIELLFIVNRFFALYFIVEENRRTIL